jgi:hypothetical protein
MESKIDFLLLFTVTIIVGACNSDKTNKNVTYLHKENIAFDSLLFGNNNQLQMLKNTFKLKDKIHAVKNGFVLKTTGKGTTIWIDTVSYTNIGQDAVCLIAKTFGDIKFIYYQGDSLYCETTALNLPEINEYYLPDSKVLKLHDSIIQFEHATQLISYYKFQKSGILLSHVVFQPSRAVEDADFDFVVWEEIKNDSFLIYKKFSRKNSIDKISL